MRIHTAHSLLKFTEKSDDWRHMLIYFHAAVQRA
jgi:hypothetical protein